MSLRRTGILCGCLALVCVVLGGCGGSAREPQPVDFRDIGKAAETYEQAVRSIDDDPERAEELLRQALAYDNFHGPAHNNLGVLLLDQGRLFEAAQAFDQARMLLPGDPVPRVNLAITLTRGGKHVDAIEAARNALEVSPGHLGAIKVLAHTQVREGLVDQSTRQHLEAIILRSDDPLWTGWAQRQRLRLDDRLPAP